VSDKLQRFTQRARRVLALAQEEAERMKHAYIGTEHLLLGLMKEEGGVASRRAGPRDPPCPGDRRTPDRCQQGRGDHGQDRSLAGHEACA